jgi:hypothetical protein
LRHERAANRPEGRAFGPVPPRTQRASLSNVDTSGRLRNPLVGTDPVGCGDIGRGAGTRSATVRPLRGILAGVLATGVALSGCSGGTNPGPAENPPPAGPTAWQSVLEGIGPDGEVDVDTARAAFVLAMGPLPAVAVPAGPGTTIGSGSGAVSWLLRRFADLTPEQRTAVTAWMRQSRDGARQVRPGSRSGGTGGGAPAGPLVAARREPPTDPAVIALGESIDEAVAEIAGRIGRPLRQRIDLLDPATVTTNSLGWSLSLDAKGGWVGEPVTCQIGVPAKTLAKSHQVILEVVIHEVFHCFEAEGFRDLATFNGKAYVPWMVEGMAEWVGNSLAGSGEAAFRNWQDYLTDPGRPLYTRSYDAIGFYAHLAESGIDPWRVFDPMFTAVQKGGNDAAFSAALAAGDATRFLDSWPSGFARGRRPGTAWDTTGPGITADAAEYTMTAITDGAKVTVAAKAAANGLHRLDLKADIITFAVSDGAHGRLGPASGSDVLAAELADGWCTKPGGCGCPGEPAPDMPVLAPGIAWLAITGGLAAAKVTVTGTSVTAHCERKTELTNCMVGTWSSTGVVVDAPSIRLRGGAGVILRIEPEGKATVEFDAMKPVKGKIGGTAPSDVTFRYEGTATFTQKVRADGTVTVAPGRFNLRAAGTMSLFGGSIPFSFPLGDLLNPKDAPKGVPQKPFGDAAAECTATTLTRTDTTSGISIVWRWKRI